MNDFGVKIMNEYIGGKGFAFGVILLICLFIDICFVSSHVTQCLIGLSESFFFY